jgi:membrane protein DedA with SNARE-associated domain
MHLADLLSQYGLIAVLIGTAIEGDFTLILAGVLAHEGYFRLEDALGVGMLGLFLGDCCWYALGRWRGRAFKASRFYARVGGTIERLAKRVGAWELIAARFVYGTKSASMIFWGLHGLPLQRFVLVDAIGCALGAGVFTGLGYLVSGSAVALLGHVQRFERFLAGIIIVAVVLVFAVNRATRRQLHIPPTDEPDPPAA